MKSVDIVPKTDIRQLIKASKSNSDSVDHPHARINNLGRISCILCGVQIKSKHAWAAHILSKTHKQNAVQKSEGTLNFPSRSTNNSNPGKVGEPSRKTRKLDTADTKLDDGVKGEQSSLKISDTLGTEGTKKSENSTGEVASSAIPEGFFDDPYKDAKIRNVPYKDKMDEEVTLFQKQMIALEKESEAISEKENEQRLSRRELEEIDSQMEKWERIEKLLRKKEALGSKLKESVNPSTPGRLDAAKTDVTGHPSTVAVKQEVDTSDSDLNDEDIDEMYDFRRKKTV